MMKLNVGCGMDVQEGYTNIDWCDYGNNRIQIVDVTRFPWPFADGIFDEIKIQAVLEHLPDQVKTMEEVHRICKKGAVVKISVPHFSGTNTWDDPTHLRGYSTHTLRYFCGDGSSAYRNGQKPPLFRMRKEVLNVSAALPFLNIVPRILGHRLYERFFSYLIPCQGLYVELEAI
ncbi:MAG: methyltransferase domain-containing protein [Lentisphaerae bacterium]|nr:methyltransferase domain-containing protein [Lentisphaerota bacterium]